MAHTRSTYSSVRVLDEIEMHVRGVHIDFEETYVCGAKMKARKRFVSEAKVHYIGAFYEEVALTPCVDVLHTPSTEQRRKTSTFEACAG